MNDSKSEKRPSDLWPKPPKNEDHLDPLFTDKILNQVEKRQTFKDLLFMIALGFWDILRGFLKVDPPRTKS